MYVPPGRVHKVEKTFSATFRINKFILTNIRDAMTCTYKAIFTFFLLLRVNYLSHMGPKGQSVENLLSQGHVINLLITKGKATCPTCFFVEEDIMATNSITGLEKATKIHSYCERHRADTKLAKKGVKDSCRSAK